MTNSALESKAAFRRAAIAASVMVYEREIEVNAYAGCSGSWRELDPETGCKSSLLREGVNTVRNSGPRRKQTVECSCRGGLPRLESSKCKPESRRINDLM